MPALVQRRRNSCTAEYSFFGRKKWLPSLAFGRGTRFFSRFLRSSSVTERAPLLPHALNSQKNPRAAAQLFPRRCTSVRQHAGFGREPADSLLGPPNPGDGSLNQCASSQFAPIPVSTLIGTPLGRGSAICMASVIIGMSTSASLSWRSKTSSSWTWRSILLW